MVTKSSVRRICESSQLVDGGAGVRFVVNQGGVGTPAFVVRHDNTARAYVNVCAHRGVELDWESGQFFDADRRWLICSAHGALYDPRTGSCVGGPCRAGLLPLPIFEAEGHIWFAVQDGLDLEQS